MALEIRLLGPLEVRDDRGSEVALGAPKLRAVLQVLALEPRRAIHVDQLIDDVWDHDPPAQALVSLRSYVSNLRRALRRDGTDRPVVVTRGQGYLLDVEPDELDTTRFERLVTEGRRMATAGEHAAAVATLEEALSLWRGPALADIATLVVAAAPVARLEQLRSTAREERLRSLLALGEHHRVVADAEGLVHEEPLNERIRGLQVRALHGVGRTPDALASHRAFRALLAEELGLDPSPDFLALEGRMLRHDPTLDEPAPSLPTGPATGSAVAVHPGPTSGAWSWARAQGSALVGRRAERARLAVAVDRLAEGAGGVATICGEPGIGKSALAAEAALRAHDNGTVVVVGRCSEIPGAAAFWPWTQVLHDVASAVGPARWEVLTAPHAALLAKLVPALVADTGTADADEVQHVDGQALRFELHRAVIDVLGRVAADTGLLVVVDDLHWADLASAELTAHLAAAAAGARILLLATHRDTPVDATPELSLALAGLHREAGGLQLRIRGLTEPEVGAFLEAMHLAPDSGADAAVLHTRTGGNPFHLRQLGEVLREGGDVAEVAERVRSVLARRLDRLPTPVRAVLEVVAVLGPADPGLVARVAGRDVLDVLEDLDVAAEHGLLRPPAPRAAVEFAHALVRETALAELGLRRLVSLHAEAGRTLADLPEPPAQAIAEHFWQAADVVGTERAVTALLDGATAAQRVFATEQAEDLLRRALSLLEHGDAGTARLELAVRTQLLHVLKGVHGWTAQVLLDAMHDLHSLAVRVGATADLMPMWWSLWALHMTRGEFDAAQAVAAQLLAAADETRPATVAAGHVSVGYTGLFRGLDPADAVAHALVAEAACERAALEELALVPEHLTLATSSLRTVAHALDGDGPAAMTAAEHGVAFAVALDDPFRIAYAHLFAAWGAALLDDPERAAAYGDAGVAAAEAAGLPALTALIEPNRTWGHARLGHDPARWIAAGRAVEEALVAAGQRHAVPHGRLLRAEVEALHGDPAAPATLAAARALAEEIGECVYERQFARVGRVVAAAGRPAAGPTGVGRPQSPSRPVRA